ncbi:MAG: Ig-like domain-containing protein [Pseudonocardiaceae bacterium]
MSCSRNDFGTVVSSSCNYFGGGGGGQGYPNAGSGGKAGNDSSGGGGAGGGDSYTGGPANTAGTTQGLLIFDTIEPAPRVGGYGWVKISYLIPSTQGFTSADPATSTGGQPVTYSTVIQDNAGITTPTGTVTFYVGTTRLCGLRLSPDPVTFAAGSGSCTASNAPVGTDTVITHYSGDGTFPSSDTSATPITVTVVRPPPTATTTSLTVSGPASQGYPILFAQVARKPDHPAGAGGTIQSPVSDGTAQFLDGAHHLFGPVPVIGGVASLIPTEKLTLGPHSLTAIFTPTDLAAFTRSTSPPVLVTVRPLF